MCCKQLGMRRQGEGWSLKAGHLNKIWNGDPRGGAPLTSVLSPSLLSSSSSKALLPQKAGNHPFIFFPHHSWFSSQNSTKSIYFSWTPLTLTFWKLVLSSLDLSYRSPTFSSLTPPNLISTLQLVSTYSKLTSLFKFLQQLLPFDGTRSAC